MSKSTWKKKGKLGLSVLGIALASIAIINNAFACCPADCNKMYVSLFGGAGSSHVGNLTQKGTAFFVPPLAVNASGPAQVNSAWMEGMNVGYQWRGWRFNVIPCSPCWSLIPAVELEGYYLGNVLHAIINNPTARLEEHSFHDTFPQHIGVFLANTVWTLNVPQLRMVSPYVGGGIGGSYISIVGADSFQYAPAEPGVNHFNTRVNDSSWVFAAQAKAGLKVKLTQNWSLFGEYRYLYMSPTNYTFGQTKYPQHVPTTNWRIHVNKMQYTMGVVGAQYSFNV